MTDNEHEPSNHNVHVKWHTYNVSLSLSLSLSLSPSLSLSLSLGLPTKLIGRWKKENVKDVKSLSVCLSLL